MRSIKRFIIALLSFLLLFIITSFADITFHVKAYTPLERFTSRFHNYPRKPTWWPPKRPTSTPTPTPTPTKTPNPPPAHNGAVSLQAYLMACGYKSPFAGLFALCETKTQAIESCQALLTDKDGQGKLITHPGMYVVRPPSWCPPGAYCIAPQVLIADPFTWNINPQSFYLSPDGAVHVAAVGQNNLLMCY